MKSPNDILNNTEDNARGGRGWSVWEGHENFLNNFFLLTLQDAYEYAMLRMPPLIFVSLTVFLLSSCLLVAVIVPNGMFIFFKLGERIKFSSTHCFILFGKTSIILWQKEKTLSIHLLFKLQQNSDCPVKNKDNNFLKKIPSRKIKNNFPFTEAVFVVK